MHSRTVVYRSLDDLHYERDKISWYWKLIAQFSACMILGGYLILPSTFDTDPKLRFSKGALSIIIVAFLTGGYSLTALLWFACPSILFRQEHIFLPTTSVSAFGFLATVWALMTSDRFSASLPSCPVTITLTLLSTAVYGILALYTHRSVQRMTSQPHMPLLSMYQEQELYPSYASSPYQQTAYSTSDGASLQSNTAYYQIPGPQPPHAATTLPDPSPPQEREDPVQKQMAKLLKATEPRRARDSDHDTFRLEWPPGGDMDEEGDLSSRGGTAGRTRTLSAGGRLSLPGPARHSLGGRADQRQRSESVRDPGGRWARVVRAVGLERGRPENRREEGEAAEGARRAKSREERRREIELGQMS